MGIQLMAKSQNKSKNDFRPVAEAYEQSCQVSKIEVFCEKNNKSVTMEVFVC